MNSHELNREWTFYVDPTKSKQWYMLINNLIEYNKLFKEHREMGYIQILGSCNENWRKELYLHEFSKKLSRVKNNVGIPLTNDQEEYFLEKWILDTINHEDLHGVCRKNGVHPSKKEDDIIINIAHQITERITGSRFVKTSEELKAELYRLHVITNDG